MPSASWLNGWIAGDTWPSTEVSKSMGSFFDSTLGVATASFDITSVPTWGTKLVIDLVARGDTVATTTAVRVRFNNDSTANYFDIFGQFTDAAVSEGGDVAAASSTGGGLIAAASANAGVPGCVRLEIPAFRSTTFVKLVSGQSYTFVNTGTGAQFSRTFGGMWNNTAAITRVTILPAAGNFITGSRCTAYVLGP